MSPSISLKTHIDDVLGVIQWEELCDIVLCGHSYGGTVISGVAEQAVDQIRSLVFLDAFVPEDGQSHMALFPPEYAQLNAADVAWANAMCGKHPLACFEQKVALSGARERVARRTYIVATGWASPFETFAKRFAQDPAWQVKRIDCGHLIMLDRPQELAEILLTTA